MKLALLGLFWTGFLLATVQAPALAGCSEETAQSHYPAIVQSIAVWSKEAKVAIAAAARKSILLDFCDAAEDVAADGKYSVAQINSAIPTAVSEFLENESEPALDARGIGASLRSALGASGLSRATIKRLRTITIQTEHQLDELAIDGEAQAFQMRFMVSKSEGHTLKGRYRKILVCTGEILPFTSKTAPEEKVWCK